MKKLFGLFIPLCIVSFVAFGISVAVLGLNTPETSTNSMSVGFSQVVEDMVFSSSNEWEFEPSPSIQLQTAGINAKVSPTENENCSVKLNNPSGKNIYVGIKTTGEVLQIEIHPKNITFGEVDFGVISWLDDIFSGSNNVSAEILMPEAIYNELNVQQGSGSLDISNIYCSNSNISIGSGEFSYSREKYYTGDYTSVSLSSGTAKLDNICAGNMNSFTVSSGSLTVSADAPQVTRETNLRLDSGSVVLNNAESEKFDLDIGSGKFEINGLSGDGRIDMGSGRGKISYLNVNGLTSIDLGSGNLSISLPKDTAACLAMDIGSGTVDVNFGGNSKTYYNDNDDDIVFLGEIGNKSNYFRDEDGIHYINDNGEDVICGFEADMGSGHISFGELPYSSSEYSEELTSKPAETVTADTVTSATSEPTADSDSTSAETSVSE